ncbi:ABC transporter permease [Streptomyces sp. V4-01]|uniref:ABC transporter permease n=1 Tax=Actinacidiphila polyblastidii TaxID=3110430 RepID=A0ABU7P8C5_9ACTN|nr:ABC transporter permease [Streptomyces sp. V4-01]
MTGFVLLRVRAHRLLLAAALLTVVLTTSVLATFTAFTGAIGDAALRRTLQHQDAARATVEVEADVSESGASALDTAVRERLAGSFAGLPTQVHGTTRSGPYGLPFALRPAGAPRGGDPDLTLLATFDRSRLTLVSGSWPAPAAPGSAEVQTALPLAAAQALKVAPGRTIELTNRLGGPRLRVRVAGVYRPADPASPYWHLDPLGGRGVHTVAFTTYGPMLVDPADFTSGRVAAAAMAWQAQGDFRHASASGMDALENSVGQTVQDLKDGSATASVQTTSALPGLIDALRRSMLVTRSTLLIGALQLVILAAFALLLVAQLLAEERAGETALLRARGGSRARVGRLAATEALLLAVPAAVAAPLLAGPVTRLLAGTGAMARTGVSLGDGSAAAAWLVALGAALACAVAVTAPAVRSGGAYAVERAARARRGALPGALQAGGDLGLLVIAGVAYWQLQRRASGSGTLSTKASGGLGVDPVLVAAPALCLLAGTVLVLRLLPLAARLGERRAARGRGLALALAGWQLSRRPRRGAGAAMLLVLSVAMGMFAIGQGASWDRSQRDQAQFAVGSDVRVTGMTTPPFGQAGIFASVPGVAAAAPATREQLLLTQQREATALVVDTRQAGRAMQLRSDLTDGRPIAALLAPLRAGRAADPAGFALPQGARTVAFTATLSAVGADGRPQPGSAGEDHLVATVVDGAGAAYGFVLGDLPPDGAPHRLVLDLGSQIGTAGGAPAGPVRLVGVDAVYSLPGVSEHHLLTLRSARVTAADGSVRDLAADPREPWEARSSFDNPDLGGLPDQVQPQVSAPRTTGGTLLAVAYTTGSEKIDPHAYDQPPSVTVRLRPRAPAPPPIAGVATDSYLKAVGAKVGGMVKVQLSGVDIPVRITAAVHALPGTGPGLTGDPSAADPGLAGADAAAGGDAVKDAGALVLDLRAVDRLLERQDALPLQPSEWWVAARPGDAAKVAAALRARTDVDTLLVRDETADELRADPLGAGPQSALPAAVIAASVLAAVGFAVSAVGAVRERSGEFAVLRALGAPRRRLARMIAAEQGLLVLVSLAVGIVLGALLTRMVTPLIVLTAQAARPVPELRVELPPGRLAELLAVVVAVPLLVVLATALRRGDPATALRRQGED